MTRLVVLARRSTQCAVSPGSSPIS